MKIGDYKKDSNPVDYDFSKPADGEGAEAQAAEAQQVEAEAQAAAQQESQEAAAQQAEAQQADEAAQALAQQEQAEAQAAEAARQQEESSLTPDHTQQGQLEINDELALSYLSEKLGRKVESFDDINQTQADPLADDPYLKGLADWRQKTGRPIEDWIKYQKDYSKMGDLDIAREFLQHEYPTLTKEEINLELSRNFIESEDDMGNEGAIKRLELKKYASKGKNVLNDLVSQFDEPLNNPSLTPEVKEDLVFAKQVKEEFAKNKTAQQSYESGIKAASVKAEAYKLNLSEDLSIDFKIAEGDRNSLPNLIQDMPHWKNDDGSWNHEAVVQDGIKIQNFDKMIKLAYEQGLNAGKDGIIKETKNITLDGRSSHSSNQNDSSKKGHIEGLDEYLGKGVGFGFKNRRG